MEKQILKVCGPRVMVRVEKLEDVDPTWRKAKEAGLAIPEGREKRSEQTAVDQGVVLSIGDAAWKDWGDGTPWANVGDKVVFAKYAGKIYKDPATKEEVTLLNDEDIIAVVPQS